MGYIIFAFENGIGNISPPELNKWVEIEKQTLSSKIIVYLVYIVWLSNQFILLIVLLNFVIALISEIYEKVMDQKMYHEYE